MSYSFLIFLALLRLSRSAGGVLENVTLRYFQIKYKLQKVLNEFVRRYIQINEQFYYLCHTWECTQQQAIVSWKTRWMCWGGKEDVAVWEW